MALPNSFIVRLNGRTEIIDDGTALVGGSPTRYVRLSPAAAGVLNYGEVSAATPVGAALAEKLLELGMAAPDVSALPECEASYTIVIPVMNRADALARLLDSVVSATAATPAARLRGQPRIIVVDDASTNPGVIEKVARAHSAEFLPLPKNVGPAGARNAGLALVTTEFVVFLDSDLVINEQTMPTLLKHFADPKVAVVTPRITALSAGALGWLRCEHAVGGGRRPRLAAE